MTTTSDAADWTLLGGDPAPGDPAAVRATAERLLHAALQAVAAERSTAMLATAVRDGSWRGAAATSVATAVTSVGPEVALFVDAGQAAGRALQGWANVLESVQASALDLLATATAAEANRVAAEEHLEVLQADRTARASEHDARRSAWRVVQSEADTAVALGSPTAVALQAEADRLAIAVNDALAALAVLDADITATTIARDDARARLDSARADAAGLALRLRTDATATAAELDPVPPFTGGAFGTAAGNGGAGVAPPGRAPATGAVRGVAVAASPAAHRPDTPAASPSPPGAPQPAAAAHPDPRRDGPPPVAAEDMVRVASALDAVRTTGAPIAVAMLSPTLQEFQRFRRIGLQAVTARGAALARAFGFEGTIGGLGWRPTPTDHSKGLAIDLMTYDDVATGQALADFYRAHHEELGVTYVIWNGQICSPVGDWAWRPYTHPAGRTDPTAMHLDHVHVSFDGDENAYACACFGVTA
ncbi:hypothetical protein [Euzebya rosea]|uniref:hypothetical protein n=1 Tax=Euzebya rosea TaxID=2052804 RepID=UPI001300A246|nr:hypothetical protein [Euzebya rosea]